MTATNLLSAFSKKPLQRALLGLISLSLSACGEPVLNTQGVDTTQATSLLDTPELTPGSKGQQQALTPGSKGPQELSGKLLQRVFGQDSVKPASGEILLVQLETKTEIRIPVGADGTFSLPEGLSDGDYAVSANLLSGKLSYRENFYNRQILQGKPLSPLELTSYLVSIKGRISLEGQDQALGAQVSINELNLRGQTDSQGNFNLGEAPAALLKGATLQIHKANFSTINQPLDEVTDLPAVLGSTELKSIVPLSQTSVLERSIGNVVLKNISRPTQPERDFIYAPEAGLANGSAAEARFNRPGQMALATDGTLYVADTGNHAIRKISPQGQVSTLAGGSAGLADGIGATARFNAPSGLALAADGTLYVADTGNHAIRKISPQGQVSTLVAGQGYRDGSLDQALLQLPTDLGLDSAGNLYILDLANQAIRKLTVSGQLETVFKSDWQARGLFQQLFDDYLQLKEFAFPLSQAQSPDKAQLLVPRSLAVSPDGTLYVSDAASFMVYRLGPDGQVQHFAGNSRLFLTGSSDARRDQISFNNPQSLAVDAQGTLYLSDLDTIYRIPEQGLPTKLANIMSLSLGYREQERYLRENIFYPGGLLLNPDGSLMLSDRQSHGIYRLWTCEQAQGPACSQTPFYAR